MITFVTWLRCFASILITNSHYNGIYPTDVIANGGLLGDILFFFVSGYCLTNIRTNFVQWYCKRLMRILPAVILISLIYVAFGKYDLGMHAVGTKNTLLYQFVTSLGLTYPKWLSWFVYPTHYHFIASILVLYVPYYFILKNEYTRHHVQWLMGIVFVCCVVLYIFAYDKGVYRIDHVREPFIRFLLMESMLLGAWFKLNDEKLRNRGMQYIYMICMVMSFALYCVSKIFLVRGYYPQYQIFNQMIIMMLLFFIVRWLSSIDQLLERTPEWMAKIVRLIAKLTLEIYLVQYVLIDCVRALELAFPLNWIVLTGLIIGVAFVLHVIVERLVNGMMSMVGKIENRCKNK